MDVRVGGPGAGSISVRVGSIIVATGFDSYQPEAGEFGYGIDGVLTLPEFKDLLDRSSGPLVHNGKPVRSVVYVYCVGSRQAADGGGANEYCSRFCCTAAVHASVQAPGWTPRSASTTCTATSARTASSRRSTRESRELGSVFLRFPDDEPPAVALGPDGRLVVTARDLLTGGEELAIPVDLVVLVTGMVPRRNEDLVGVLKLPLGSDGFFNEIHPKLRPVETVVDGVLIAGACQGPKTSSESVASGLAAVTQSAAILRKGFAELDPLVATVNAGACTACGEVPRRVSVRRDRDGEPGRSGDRGHQRDGLQGLRRLRPGLSGERHRPASATPTPRSRDQIDSMLEVPVA